MTRLYLAARRHLPDLLDCRPIPLPGLLTDDGWHLQARQQLSVAGLPATAALATPARRSRPCTRAKHLTDKDRRNEGRH